METQQLLTFQDLLSWSSPWQHFQLPADEQADHDQIPNAATKPIPHAVLGNPRPARMVSYRNLAHDCSTALGKDGHKAM